MIRRSPSLLSLLLLVSLSCQEAAAPPGDVEEGARPVIATNVIATNVIATNAITANAIATSAIASNALAGHFPTDGSLGIVTQPEVAIGLEDPDAQTLMKYLVSCALLPGQRLQWTSRFSGITRTWRGDLGLCPQWLASAPSASCRERVSACLLARNNVFGITVPLSLRGDRDGVDLLPLASTVPLWPKVWRTSTTVNSALPCRANESGVTRNCGWQSAGVGRCTPGQQVRAGAGGCGLGESNGNTMLRSCTRMHFCDHGSPALLAQSDDACGTAAPLVEFTCPPDGFYGLMAANHDSASGPASVSVAADPPRFPSSEAQVFTWREGAFYGTIFDAGALNQLKPQVRVNPQTGQVEEQLLPGVNVWVPGKRLSSLFAGVVHLKMWACSSDNWTLPDAYYERRLCAGIGGVNCAAKYAGPCRLLCQGSDGEDLHHGECADLTGQRWPSPITSVLHHPCDVLSASAGTVDETLCRTVAALPIP